MFDKFTFVPIHYSKTAYTLFKNEALWRYFFFFLHMREREFSVACNGKVPSTYRFPGADLVLFTCSHQTMLSKIRKFSSKIDSGFFTKITRSPPKYRLLHQNNGFSTKICGGVFEQLARYTMRYQESDLHLGLYSSLTSANHRNLPTLVTLFYISTLLCLLVRV